MTLTILIIEDNAANLELMRYLLAAAGHTVLTAGDGQAGLALAIEAVPDVVLCDLQMPVMDGYAFAARLREVAALAATPLIAVTASAMQGDRQRVLAAGFDGYLTKPLEPETFGAEVLAFYAQQRERAP